MFAEIPERLSSVKRTKYSSSFRYFAPRAGECVRERVREGGPSVLYRCRRRRRRRRSERRRIRIFLRLYCLSGRQAAMATTAAA